MNLEPSFVYIMTNKPRGTLYLGVTADLVRRVSEHKQRAGRSFTARCNLDKLVWFETFGEIELAIQRETSLKRWDRAWKIELIEKGNPDWRDLFEDVQPGVILGRIVAEIRASRSGDGEGASIVQRCSGQARA